MSSVLSTLRSAADAAAERVRPALDSFAANSGLRRLSADLLWGAAAGLRPHHVGHSRLAGAAVFGGLVTGAVALEVEDMREDFGRFFTSQADADPDAYGETARWAAPVSGLVAAALWPVNVRANDWLDRGLERLGVDHPALAVGLAGFAASRGFRQLEDRGLGTWDQIIGADASITLPPEILDLLLRVTDPHISPLPSAAEEIQKQLRTAAFSFWVIDELEALEDGGLSGDALLDAPCDLVDIDIPGAEGPGPIVPRAHTYPVHGRITVGGVDCIVELRIEDGWLSQIMFYADTDDDSVPDLLTFRQWAEAASGAQIEVEAPTQPGPGAQTREADGER